MVGNLIPALHYFFETILDNCSRRLFFRSFIELMDGLIPVHYSIGATSERTNFINADNAENLINLIRSQIRVMSNYGILVQSIRLFAAQTIEEILYNVLGVHAGITPFSKTPAHEHFSRLGQMLFRQFLRERGIGYMIFHESHICFNEFLDEFLKRRIQGDGERSVIEAFSNRYVS